MSSISFFSSTFLHRFKKASRIFNPFFPTCTRKSFANERGNAPLGLADTFFYWIRQSGASLFLLSLLLSLLLSFHLLTFHSMPLLNACTWLMFNEHSWCRLFPCAPTHSFAASFDRTLPICFFTSQNHLIITLWMIIKDSCIHWPFNTKRNNCYYNVDDGDSRSVRSFYTSYVHG